MSDPERYPLSQPMRLSELCAQMDASGTFVGEADPVLTSAAALDRGDETSISFCRFGGEVGRSRILASRAAVIVCSDAPAPVPGRVFIQVADPRGWFIDALHRLNPDDTEASIDATARIGNAALLGDDIHVGAHAVIEAGARIGSGCRIGAFAYISGASILEAGVTVQAHVAIGTHGLSFHKRPDGSPLFFPHMGKAIVREGAAIGTHTTIVRGILDNTEIGAGAQIGNHVNVGHNCAIGREVFISSGTVLTGSVRIGDRTRLAAGVTVTAHCSIGQDAHVGLGSVVVKDIADGKRVFGNPARPLPTMREF
ncbi:hypothetical protein [Maricaulis sp.]|uniref:hypothetical protein n=1 Tax=Maricaulis sp. TaxID=1486257 RepID=UPI0026319F69|nr:hypothetical protein [Maricaulis sp.]